MIYSWWSVLALILALAFAPRLVSAQSQATCYDMQVHNSERVDLLCFVNGDTIATPTATPVPPTPTSGSAGGGATATRTPTATTGAPSSRSVPDQYPSITAALVGIMPGSTVTVHAGTYPEFVVVGVPNVTIMAAPGDSPWIDGECARDNGIQILADDVVVRGLGIKKTNNQAILIGDVGDHLPARVVVDHNVIQDYNCANGGDAVNAGIAVWYSGSGIQITNNMIQRRVEVAGTKQGTGNGIWFKSSSALPSGGGHTISGNTIVGGWDGIGGEVEGDPHGSFDKNTTISANIVALCGDDGIQSEGGGQGILIQNNQIHECGTGIALATPLTGTTTVSGNTITSHTVGTFGNLMCFKIGYVSTATMVISGNTCTIPAPVDGAGHVIADFSRVGNGIQQTNSGSGVWQVSNNTWNVYGYIFNIAYTAPNPGSVFDGDCMVGTDPTGRFIKWAGSAQVATLTAFRQMGYESHGRMGPC